MSKVAAMAIDPISSLIGAGVKSVSKGIHSKTSGVQPLPERGGPADPEIAKRVTEQMATREAGLQRAAVAAGAQRSENDADLLGYTTPKRRSARRTLGSM